MAEILNTEQNALSYSVAQTQVLRLVMARQAETWVRLQSDMLEDVNEFTMGWMRRRREATTAALETIERFAAAKDVTGTLAAYSDWVGGSMMRLVADRTSPATYKPADRRISMPGTRRSIPTTGTAIWSWSGGGGHAARASRSSSVSPTRRAAG